MAEVKNLALAKSVYATLCRTLEKNDWRYTSNEEELKISCGAQGEDLLCEFVLHADPLRRLVAVAAFDSLLDQRGNS